VVDAETGAAGDADVSAGVARRGRATAAAVRRTRENMASYTTEVR
jgi:hypothetical protein